jgi:hypothetical protein
MLGVGMDIVWFEMKTEPNQIELFAKLKKKTVISLFAFRTELN